VLCAHIRHRLAEKAVSSGVTVGGADWREGWGRELKNGASLERFTQP